MQAETKKRRRISYVVLILLLAQTGFPFFFGDVYLGIFAAFTGLIFLIQGHKIDKTILKIIVAFVVLMLFQMLYVGGRNLGPFVGIILRLLYAFLAIRVVGKNFTQYYVKTLYFFTVLGLIMWVILGFVPGAYDAAKWVSLEVVKPFELYPFHLRNNLIIYTNDYWLLQTFPRNAGPFWEAGAFGVFLIAGILFNTINTQKLVNKTNIVFTIAVVTTFSFGSYVALLLFLAGYLFFIDRLRSKYVFLIVLGLIGVFGYSYTRVDFLGEKLEKRENKVSNNINERTEYGNLNKQVGRNEKLRLDLRAFAKSPVFGEGQFKKYKFGNSSVGITAMLRKWGILGFLLFFGTMYYSFLRYTRVRGIQTGYAKLAVLTFLAVSLTQSLWGKPFFLTFIFMYLVLTEFKPKKKIGLVTA